MSVTEIWGPCGHNWLDFGAWVTGDLDEGEERDVEAQFAACDTCWNELQETITILALLCEAVAVVRQQQVGRCWWPRRGHRIGSIWLVQAS